MKKLLYFSFYKGYYFFLGFWILDILRAVVEEFLKHIEIKDERIFIDIKEKNLFDLICLNISDLLAFILHYYTKVKSRKSISIKENEQSNDDNQTGIRLIYNKYTIMKKNNLLIITSTILDFFARSVFLIYSFYDNEKDKKNEENNEEKNDRIDFLVIIDIFSRALISKIFLKRKIYQHHIVSIFITFSGFLMQIISYISVFGKDFNYIYYLIIFPKYILFPIADAINEIILNYHFFFPQHLMFIRGVFEFFILFILCSILRIIGIIDFRIFIKENPKILYQILLRLSYIIISFFRTFFLMKVIYLYDSQHVSFLIITFTFTNFIKGNIFDGDNTQSNDKNYKIYFILGIISLLFIFLGVLIYNEILIINACGLNEYTKKGFEEKIENDFASINRYSIMSENNDQRESVTRMTNGPLELTQK